MDAERPGALNQPPSVEARLRQAGLRSTRQRSVVLGALDELRGHRRADDLVLELVDRGTALPRSTVFNVLDDLVAAGLVLKADLGGGAARYERADATTPHHHFVCRVCGSIEDVEIPELAGGIEAAVALASVDVDTVEVVLRGRCAQCAASDRPN